MNLIKFLRLAFLSFILTFHNAFAMQDDSGPKTAGKVSLKISKHELGKPLSVTLESKNLFMRNIEGTEDLNYYYQIFCTPKAMEKYMEGVPREPQEVIGRHKRYFTCWLNGNPYSSYLTFLNEKAALQFLTEKENLLETSQAADLKKEFAENKKIFIGHILLEPGDDRPHVKTDAEISYVFLPAFWGRRYGTEAVENIVELAKNLRQKGFTVESHAIDTLIGTARPDNGGSCGVLENNGFTYDSRGDTVKYGALRHLYTLAL
ncbi:MAG: GNAT family N-acetyltransferase [Alphaproteobacteria bacterium]|nr:GNAT family N-acetyltransferase [Alphaproteobacteria bacterium]